jgi:hypothetical protein
VNKVFLFPGVAKLPAIHEPSVDIAEIACRQAGLLERWVLMGEELKRRLGPIPIDLALDLAGLLEDSRQ